MRGGVVIVQWCGSLFGSYLQLLWTCFPHLTSALTILYQTSVTWHSPHIPFPFSFRALRRMERGGRFFSMAQHHYRMFPKAVFCWSCGSVGRHAGKFFLCPGLSSKPPAIWVDWNISWTLESEGKRAPISTTFRFKCLPSALQSAFP